MKKVLLVILVLVVALCLYLRACGDSGERVGEFNWPDSAVSARLPQPESKVGEVNYDSADQFSAEIHEVTEDRFDAYVAACKENGFTVDYYGYEGYYRADDDDGYSLTLLYDEDEEIMSISINAPIPEQTEEATTAPLTDTGDPETTMDTTAQPEETTAPTEAPETTAPAPELSDGIRPEFKEAMDSYEEFFEKYCAFMKKYNANPTDLSLLADYATFMAQYAETMEEMDKWGDSDLNDAELKYYLEVNNRITQMLLEVAD